MESITTTQSHAPARAVSQGIQMTTTQAANAARAVTMATTDSRSARTARVGAFGIPAQACGPLPEASAPPLPEQPVDGVKRPPEGPDQDEGEGESEEGPGEGC